jgi:hypothetical protein
MGLISNGLQPGGFVPRKLRSVAGRSVLIPRAKAMARRCPTTSRRRDRATGQWHARRPRRRFNRTIT